MVGRGGDRGMATSSPLRNRPLSANLLSLSLVGPHQSTTLMGSLQLPEYTFTSLYRYVRPSISDLTRIRSFSPCARLPSRSLKKPVRP